MATTTKRTRPIIGTVEDRVLQVYFPRSRGRGVNVTTIDLRDGTVDCECRGAVYNGKCWHMTDAQRAWDVVAARHGL